MQRFASLLALGLFAFLLCSFAAVWQQQNYFPPIKPLPYPTNKDLPLVDKKAISLRNRNLPSQSGKKALDFNTILLDEKEEPLLDEPEPVAVKDLLRNGEKHSAGIRQNKESNSIHFLLIGRWWEEPAATMLIMVTLVPGSCARFTALDPTIEVLIGERRCAIGQLLEQEESANLLYPAINDLTGLTPQFYIDLNLHGFVDMVDLWRKEAPGVASSFSKSIPSPKPGFDGNKMLLLLNDASVPTAAKEDILVELLLNACEIQFTKLGLKLLRIGYHNLKTDLNLRELLHIRNIAQTISPTNVNLTEITP